MSEADIVKLKAEIHSRHIETMRKYREELLAKSANHKAYWLHALDCLSVEERMNRIGTLVSSFGATGQLNPETFANMHGLAEALIFWSTEP